MSKITDKQGSNEDTSEETHRQRVQEQERQAALAELKKQQEELTKKIKDMQEDPTSWHTSARDNLGGPQGLNLWGLKEVLLQQLKTALSAQKEEHPNKALLKALVTQQNKVTGEGGISMLKPSILNKLAAGNSNTMAEWLASLNKQEEGESKISKFPLLIDDDSTTRPSKVKSGILDKATTNIQQIQVWPQQNLREDWADEEVEFKQMRFKHLVAGETRTIETCTDPAEILGRLRLLRRVSYLKLKGYDWHFIRKMYLTILTSIETKEYSWESNFDRFETIFYRWVVMETRAHNEPRQEHKEGRRRFCRD